MDVTKLTSYEKTILAALQAKQGETVSRDEITRALYPADEQPPVSNGLEVFVGRIRSKLGNDVSITTVRGVGYRLEQKAT